MENNFFEVNFVSSNMEDYKAEIFYNGTVIFEGWHVEILAQNEQGAMILYCPDCTMQEEECIILLPDGTYLSEEEWSCIEYYKECCEERYEKYKEYEKLVSTLEEMAIK